MISTAVFVAVRDYFADLFRGIRSVLGSYFTALPYLFSAGEHCKEVTEQYPDPISSKTADDLPPRTRGLLYNDIEQCTGCGECEKTCPTQCIYVETQPGPDEAKRWISVFDIDYSRCVFCGLCVEVCQPQSLVHTKRYEGSVYELPDLIASFGKGQVTDEQRENWAVIRTRLENEEGL